MSRCCQGEAFSQIQRVDVRLIKTSTLLTRSASTPKRNFTDNNCADDEARIDDFNVIELIQNYSLSSEM